MTAEFERITEIRCSRCDTAAAPIDRVEDGMKTRQWVCLNCRLTVAFFIDGGKLDLEAARAKAPKEGEEGWIEVNIT